MNSSRTLARDPSLRPQPDDRQVGDQVLKPRIVEPRAYPSQSIVRGSCGQGTQVDLGGGRHRGRLSARRKAQNPRRVTGVTLGAPETAEKEAEMHALVVRVTINDADRTRELLNDQVVPQVSGAPGFKTGYWTWSTGSGAMNGLSMVIFDSEENARAAGDRIKSLADDMRDDVTLDGTEVREVVASA